ncbi:alpha-ketoglutarate-dependent 2,4-dichlorophenoxyacetate dioxygenase [Sphingobium sp. B7D2B]|uniref:TauD/TfdA dioxygenase family protein n=1 Tax=Sphingobium sp. B7D2B TaxID=2940583 RepID=UPI002224ADD2|nr:TauD/TfdA family dioxygenase [Sphingobium sp. B7D2B]MCW2366319.1 alpha-ketoglutarate-dependent 2,4-dichlorophenoxyacetate dioxygenase [Sphingobium sp. B7D2B]
MKINQLHPRFVGEITDLDTSRPLSPETVEFFEAAMAQYAVCVIRNASLSDEDHIAFARSFGPLELAPPGRKRIAPELYDISNLTAEGEIIQPKPDGAQPADFELFHTDSPFNSWPTKWSMLLAYVTPPEGADTEFIDTRAVYDDLPEDMKVKIADLKVDHDLFRALQLNGVKFEDEEMRKNYPRMAHPLVRTSANGRKALYMGWHGVGIEGWPEDEARTFLDELYRFATQERYVYAHKWRPGDMVVWDNRCTMHSATSFERYRYKRDMRRATINEYGPEVSAIEANTRAPD